MAILSPIPRRNSSYNGTIFNASSFGANWTVGNASVSNGTLPPGLSLSSTTTVISLTGTPTTLGSYSFTITYTIFYFGSNFGNRSSQFTTQVVDAPTPVSGPIKFSDVGRVTGVTGAISANALRFRYLANGTSTGAVRMSTAYNKPARGTINLTTAQSIQWTVPAYQALIIVVAGAGGGGGGGGSAGLVTGGCVPPVVSGTSGSAGGASSALNIVAFGGGGGGGSGFPGNGSAGAAGGNNQNGSLGGGSLGGSGNTGAGFTACLSTGGTGGPGGYAESTKLITTSGIEYGTITTLTVGAGGIAGRNSGGASAVNGSPGSVYIEWA